MGTHSKSATTILHEKRKQRVKQLNNYVNFGLVFLFLAITLMLGLLIVDYLRYNVIYWLMLLVMMIAALHSSSQAGHMSRGIETLDLFYLTMIRQIQKEDDKKKKGTKKKGR